MKLLHTPVVLLLLLLCISPTLQQNEHGLHLTPLIQRGSLVEARERSLVHLDSELQVPASHAGYLTVNGANNLFFWYLESVENANTSPLLVWLSGGPSISSLQALLWENGPFTFAAQGSELIRRQVSWSNKFALLYIDNPVGTGYSYNGEDSYRSTTSLVALDLYKALKQLYKLFSTFKDRDLYIGGEGYAGKFAVELGSIIHDRNATVSLKGLYLNEPFLNPEVNMKEFINFLFNIGALSKAMKDSYTQAILRLADNPQDSLVAMDASMTPEVASVVNVENFVTREKLDRPGFDGLVRDSDISQLVRVNPDVEFSSFRQTVYDRFGNDFFGNKDSVLGTLMQTYKVLVYTGDFSGFSPGVEKVMEDLDWPLKQQYLSASRVPWKVEDNFYGFSSSIGNLCRVVLHGAGQQAPRDKPEVVLQLLSDFTQHGCVQTSYVGQ